MTHQQSLDEIYDYFDQFDTERMSEHERAELKAKFKKQTKSLFIEIVGEDEIEPATPYGAVLAVQHRNALRDKQRKLVEQL